MLLYTGFDPRLCSKLVSDKVKGPAGFNPFNCVVTLVKMWFILEPVKCACGKGLKTEFLLWLEMLSDHDNCLSTTVIENADQMF